MTGARQRRMRIHRADLDALLSQGPTEPAASTPPRDSVDDRVANLQD